MNRRLTLGAVSVAAALLVSGAVSGSPIAWAAEPAPSAASSAAPVPTGVTAIADQLLRADSAKRGPKLRKPYKRVVGIHGQATVRDKKAQYITYTWQRGTISAKAGASLTVASVDGHTATWALSSSTRYRKLGQAADLSKLAVGDKVFVIGAPGSAGPTAAAVFVPRDRPAPKPSPTPGS